MTSHVTHVGMHWRKMAEYTRVIQDAAQESGCDSDGDLLVIDVVIGRLGSNCCECRPKLSNSVDLINPEVRNLSNIFGVILTCHSVLLCQSN